MDDVFGHVEIGPVGYRLKKASTDAGGSVGEASLAKHLTGPFGDIILIENNAFHGRIGFENGSHEPALSATDVTDALVLAKLISCHHRRVCLERKAGHGSVKNGGASGVSSEVLPDIAALCDIGGNAATSNYIK